MKMIATTEIDALAQKVAQANLTSDVVSRVFSAPIVDSEGEDALLLTIVVKPDLVDAIDGSALLDTLVSIQQGLQKAGEERHAILTYTTEEDLDLGGDQS